MKRKPKKTQAESVPVRAYMPRTEVELVAANIGRIQEQLTELKGKISKTEGYLATLRGDAALLLAEKRGMENLLTRAGLQNTI